MATNNATDTSNPVSIAQGGTNASSMTNTNGVNYYDGSAIVTTTVGTAGQVLTSNGPGVAPTFQSGGGGSGGLVFLDSQTASSSATIDFTSIISGTYDVYQIFFSAVVPATNTAVLRMLNSTDNGATWHTTLGDYQAGINYTPQASSSFSNLNDPFQQYMPISAALSNTAGGGVSGSLTIYNTGNGAYFGMHGMCVFNGSTSGSGTLGWFGDAVDNTGPNGQIGVNAIRFLMSSGDIASGTFSMYGVVQ